MPTVLSFLLRLLLLAAGLVFTAGVLVVFLTLLAFWGLRMAWARLTGRTVLPFAARMRPGQAFADMMRRARRPESSPTPRADAAAGVRGRIGDVSDVEPR